MRKMKRLFGAFLASALTLTAVCGITELPAKAESETLTIRGDGIGKEVVFSRAELENMVNERHRYSVANNFPSEKTEYAEGVLLRDLLLKAEIKEDAQIIRFIASDGYRREFTVSELLSAPRFYFSETGGKTPVPVMICLQNGVSGFDGLKPENLRLVMGQRAPGEQTNPWFVKYLSVIEVSREKPAKWPEVTFSKAAGDAGVTLQLLHENFDSVKIYYTTDGSAPTTESDMYNVSASYYQPQLNKPLLISKTTVVRAVAVGAGKEDSAVASIIVSFDSPVFSDLEGYDHATPAIEALAAEEILSGVGGGRFDPEGSLTRAMFATMLGRALNKAAPAEAAAVAGFFSDVDYDSWYGEHVRWAANKGIINGYPDGTFKPTGFLSTEEMIVMAIRAGGFELTGSDDEPAEIAAGFSDWAAPYVITAEINDIYATGENSEKPGVFGADRANRAEAAVIVYKLLQVLK
ncbi:MAG: S-layer homology domain-containing protein [Oscillospiraceae bacterium]|nr:S-layer homology domain-containing protein [Oscillospiraceae bacterium]